jgi:hypothetical protein
VITICDHLQLLFCTELKNEILWKSLGVPFHGLVKCTGLDSVNGRQVGVDQNLAATNRQNQGIQRFEPFHLVLHPTKARSKSKQQPAAILDA